MNQIELHQYNYHDREGLLAYMKQHDIAVEAFRVLTPLTSHAGGKVEATVDSIADRLKKKPEQILLAWAKSKV